jgi:acyl carrier protein
MKNLDKYNQAFIDTFSITDSALKDLKYQEITEWDSVGHMHLMSSLEEKFEIELEIDDIIDFSSYSKGVEILAKYNITLD